MEETIEELIEKNCILQNSMAVAEARYENKAAKE